LPDDRAIVVHYGLPNIGAKLVSAHLKKIRLPIPLGINIVKTNRGIDAPPDAADVIIADYVDSVRLLKERADYLSLNLSCPNTEMGRDFFADQDNLRGLLAALNGLRIACPVFLKISPRYEDKDLELLLAAVAGVDFIVSLRRACVVSIGVGVGR
jgi:dihydroorotate dehydrogenase (fumarate)/dihydroorotate dehydrogenase